MSEGRVGSEGDAHKSEQTPLRRIKCMPPRLLVVSFFPLFYPFSGLVGGVQKKTQRIMLKKKKNSECENPASTRRGVSGVATPESSRAMPVGQKKKQYTVFVETANGTGR